MDGYPIQLSKSSWISTIWPNLDLARFHILCRIKYVWLPPCFSQFCSEKSGAVLVIISQTSDWQQQCTGAWCPWNDDHAVCLWSAVAIDTNGYSTGN